MSVSKYLFSILLLLSLPTVNAQKKWSLEACISYAKEHNINIVKQAIRNKILARDIKIAKGNYLPNANFNASQNFSLGNSFNVSTGVGQSESSSNSFSLSSSFAIFNGFSNKYKLQKAKLSEQKGEAEIEKIRFDLNLNITNRYLQILFNKEILKVAKEQVTISSNNFNRLQQLYKKGLTSKKELLEIEATLANDKKEVIIANNNITKGLIELREIIDVKKVENFDIQELSLLKNPNLMVEISTKNIENNPIIKTLNFSYQLKKKEIQLSKVNFYPRINFNYSYSSNYFHIIGKKDEVLNQQTNQLVPNGFFTQLKNNKTHYVGISAVIPIFNRFLTTENYKKSLDELKISELDLKNNKKLLANKIEIAQNDIEQAKASLKASKIAFLAQQEAFIMIQKNYNKGNNSSYEFLESKAKLTRNKAAYIKAKYELYFKEKILAFYFQE